MRIIVLHTQIRVLLLLLFSWNGIETASTEKRNSPNLLKLGQSRDDSVEVTGQSKKWKIQFLEMEEEHTYGYFHVYIPLVRVLYSNYPIHPH